MLYLIVGILLGSVGTLVGVGGGFLLVPLLFFLHPDMSAAKITSISLFCVALNAISGSIAFALNKKIHWAAGLLFAFLAIPGAWLGVEFTHRVSREQFDVGYAILLIFLGVFIYTRSRQPQHLQISEFKISKVGYGLGAVASFFIGALASFFGVGGGILHVPFLTSVIKMPVHIATATSQFILAITSIVATARHYQSGTLTFEDSFLFYVATGMVIGAQIGARLSRRIKAEVLLKILVVVILLVAGRILILKMTSS